MKMQKKDGLVDSFVTLENKLARLKQSTLKLVREEYALNQSDEEESAEVKMEEASCPKCRGDEGESSTPHIQDLCPADKKRISQLVAELAKCTQEKHKAEDQLAVTRSENEALHNRFKLFTSQQEDDKNQLRSKLSEATTEMNKLKMQTSHSLELLTRQMIAMETQSTKLSETVKDLLNDKIRLQDTLIEKRMRTRAAEAKVERMRESIEMEKLMFMKEHVKGSMAPKSDKDCQTEEGSTGSNTTYFSADTSQNENDPIIVKMPKTTQTKSRQDLEAPSSDAMLLRELFFNRHNVNETEGLDMFPVFPQS